MIHLDSNFLIGSLNQHSSPALLLKNWLQKSETFAASSVAWAEFMNGPVRPDQIRQVEYLVQNNVVALGRQEAEIASKLFNLTGRRRGSLPDCLIAATAICAGAKLATQNQKHFAPFISAGLSLA